MTYLYENYLAHHGVKGMQWGKRKDEDEADPRDTTGQYGRGNIDLNNRKVVHNKDGSVSTERSFSINVDGKETLIPAIIDGRIVSDEEAIDHFYRTGEHLGQFDTVEEADAYAEQLHNRQDWYYNERGKKEEKRIPASKVVSATYKKAEKEIATKKRVPMATVIAITYGNGK